MAKTKDSGTPQNDTMPPATGRFLALLQGIDAADDAEA